MAAKITTAELISRIKADPDMYALGLLPIDSFARHAYQTKSYPDIRSAHSETDAQSEECETWGLSTDEWVEEMNVARIALAHDMKLDLLRKGFAPAV